MTPLRHSGVVNIFKDILKLKIGLGLIGVKEQMLNHARKRMQHG